MDFFLYHIDAHRQPWSSNIDSVYVGCYYYYFFFIRSSIHSFASVYTDFLVSKKQGIVNFFSYCGTHTQKKYIYKKPLKLILLFMSLHHRKMWWSTSASLRNKFSKVVFFSFKYETSAIRFRRVICTLLWVAKWRSIWNIFIILIFTFSENIDDVDLIILLTYNFCHDKQKKNVKQSYSPGKLIRYVFDSF